MKKGLMIIVSIITLILLGTLIFGAYKYYNLFHRIYDPIPDTGNIQSEQGSSAISTGKETQNKDSEPKPFSILLLGVDARDDEIARSDTIIFSTVNPSTKKITLLSIPRDTLVTIPERGDDKINHAIVYGGIPLVKSTVENFLQIPVDHYLTIDFEAFRRIVDTLDGIEINVEKRMRYIDPTDGTNIDLRPGLQVLDGKNALDYARYRKSNIGPNDSDFARIDRQHEVIKAVIDKTKNNLSIFTLFKFVDIMGDHIKTDISRNQIEDMLKIYRSFSSEDLEILSLAGEDKVLPYGEYKLYFYVIDDQEVTRVNEILKKSLQLDDDLNTNEKNENNSNF